MGEELKMKKLFVVESPTKARTISNFLKDQAQILATMGHIRDLPKSRFGIKVIENGEIKFEPQYKIIPQKREIVAKVKEAVKKADQVILATDPDREGEAIAYHLVVLTQKKAFQEEKRENEKFVRIVFYEITPQAIQKALENPRSLDLNLVNAQQARRVLDRIVGYKLSPLLWRKVRRGLSAGRVQSIALRLIVEREREILRFKGEKFYRIFAGFEKQEKDFTAELVKIKDESVEKTESKKLFAGQHKVVKTIFDTADKALVVIKSLSVTPFVENLEEKEIFKQPLPPFTTSTLQQTAARKFSWSSKLTMQIAQGLYEQGLITYHRTDSTNLNFAAIGQLRKVIELKFGKNYLPLKPRIYKTKSKLAQEAHEAIRPTKPDLEKPTNLDQRASRLYRLIWQRALACQMQPAKLAITNVWIKDGDYLFKTSGTRLLFDGFTKIYPVFFLKIELPKLVKGERLDYLALGISEYQTQPPPRYHEASLIAVLEKEGIGRPSTYAPIISIIQQRLYVEKEEGKFKPTKLGVAVNDFLVEYFPKIIDLPFTAQMEDDLDLIAQGKKEWTKTVAEFWRPFINEIEKTKENSKRVKVEEEKVDERCPECQKGELVVRIGKFGKFIACSRFPDCRYTRPYLQQTNFSCPDCGAPAVIRKTKKGKMFYGCSRWPSCKWASWRKPKNNQ